MKTIYEVFYPLGYEPHEVEDNHPVTLPFVAAPPLDSLENPQSQFFNFSENKWEEAVTQDYSKKLGLLENLSAGLQADNTALKTSNEALIAKTESMAQLNAKTMLTTVANSKDIAAIKNQLPTKTTEVQ